jgi:hypothetical protein
VLRLGEGGAGDLSPDGKWALGAIPTAPVQLMLYPTGAGEARRLDQNEIETYTTALFFPDGKRLLLCGHEHGRANRCFVRDLEGGAMRPVTPEGTWGGVVSADGTSVLAQSGSGEYILYPIAGGTPRPLPALAANEQIALLSADGRSAYVFRGTDLPSRIERVDLESGRRELFKEITPADRAGVLNLTNVTLSADERAYAYSYYRHLSHLFVVDGAR